MDGLHVNVSVEGDYIPGDKPGLPVPCVLFKPVVEGANPFCGGPIQMGDAREHYGKGDINYFGDLGCRTRVCGNNGSPGPRLLVHFRNHVEIGPLNVPVFVDELELFCSEAPFREAFDDVFVSLKCRRGFLERDSSVRSSEHLRCYCGTVFKGSKGCQSQVLVRRFNHNVVLSEVSTYGRGLWVKAFSSKLACLGCL